MEQLLKKITSIVLALMLSFNLTGVCYAQEPVMQEIVEKIEELQTKKDFAEKSTDCRFTRAGVPVLKRIMVSPSASSEAESPTAGRSPSGPAA